MEGPPQYPHPYDRPPRDPRDYRGMPSNMDYPPPSRGRDRMREREDKCSDRYERDVENFLRRTTGGGRDSRRDREHERERDRDRMRERDRHRDARR